jgi:hypothetical protein
MKKLLLALFLVAFSGVALAQKRYSITPGHVLIDKVKSGGITSFKIYQQNISNSDLILKWQLISDEVVKGWDYSSCAYGICYAAIPDTLCTMNPIAPGDEGFLSLLINPMDIPGTGKATLYLYDSENPSVKDTVTFIITSEPGNGIHKDVLANAWSVYPNPASEMVNIKIDHGGSSGSIRIMDVIGQTVYQTSANTGLNPIPVSSLSAGIYFVRYDSGDGNFSAKKLEIIK